MGTGGYNAAQDVELAKTKAAQRLVGPASQTSSEKVYDTAAQGASSH